MPLSAPPTPQEAPRRHDMPLSTEFDDLITGHEYCATLQLRTPLEVLRLHGRVVPKSPDGPPMLTDMMWHGIWTPLQDSRYDFLSEGATMASEVGYVPRDGGDYLVFLMGVREITEGTSSIAEKEKALRALMNEGGPAGTQFSRFIGVTELIDRALPYAIHELPVSKPTGELLRASGYTTLEDVSRATDKDLRAIKGIGPKSLTAIREYLATTTVDQFAERLLADDFKPLQR